MMRRISVVAAVAALGLATTACSTTKSAITTTGEAIGATGHLIGNTAGKLFGLVLPEQKAKKIRIGNKVGHYVYYKDAQGRLHRRFVVDYTLKTAVKKAAPAKDSSIVPPPPGQNIMKKEGAPISVGH